MKPTKEEQRVLDNMKARESYKSYSVGMPDVRTLREMERKGLIKSYVGDSGSMNYYKQR